MSDQPDEFLPREDSFSFRAPVAAPVDGADDNHAHVQESAEDAFTVDLASARICRDPEIAINTVHAPTPLPAPSEPPPPAPDFLTAPGAPVQAAAGPRHVRANGKANPYRPETPDQILSFAPRTAAKNGPLLTT